MMQFRFEATPMIASYWPMLLKKQWWDGYQNPENGNVTLFPKQSDGTDLHPSITGLIITAQDVAETRQGSLL